MPAPHLVEQLSLLAAIEAVDFDRSFLRVRRVQLDEDSWVDHVPGWVSRGPEALA